VRTHVEKGAQVFTDALKSYAGLSPEYVHSVIGYAECYVKGNVHTNGMENFWSLFKRCIKGTQERRASQLGKQNVPAHVFEHE
jgi:hypothetical protein